MNLDKFHKPSLAITPTLHLANNYGTLRLIGGVEKLQTLL